jgi:hypothetical protein
MDINTLREYINIHIISLEQDLMALGNYLGDDMSEPWFLNGQIASAKHILEVINE